jgi:hypothetical protein
MPYIGKVRFTKNIPGTDYYKEGYALLNEMNQEITVVCNEHFELIDCIELYRYAFWFFHNETLSY